MKEMKDYIALNVMSFLWEEKGEKNIYLYKKLGYDIYKKKVLPERVWVATRCSS
jgi:hypothetical protein